MYHTFEIEVAKFIYRRTNKWGGDIEKMVKKNNFLFKKTHGAKPLTARSTPHKQSVQSQYDIKSTDHQCAHQLSVNRHPHKLVLIKPSGSISFAMNEEQFQLPNKSTLTLTHRTKQMPLCTPWLPTSAWSRLSKASCAALVCCTWARHWHTLRMLPLLRSCDRSYSTWKVQGTTPFDCSSPKCTTQAL